MEKRSKQHTARILMEIMRNYSLFIEVKKEIDILKTSVFEEKDNAVICRKSLI